MVVATWAVAGVLLLLVQAVARLLPRALEALHHPSLDWLHVGLLIGWSAWMVYAEGYKGFQRSFCPRVVARAFHLGANPRWWQIALAPAFAMGFFHADRRTLIVAWGVTAAVVGLVLVVSLLEQPWRGIIDAGVVLGLGWGAVSLLVLYLRALGGRLEDARPWLPAAESGEPK